jgi:hypothetical protein
MAFMMFLIHTLLRVLAAANPSDVVFIARHMAGLSVETHFFYFDKSVADASLPTDPVEKFRHLSGRGGEGMMARSYSKSSPLSVFSCHLVIAFETVMLQVLSTSEMRILG